MKLLVVESPAKARTISKYAGGDYTVMSSVGHIRDLPKSNKEAIDIEAGFVPKYQIVPGKEDVVRELKRECKKADEVVLATDPDREGEAIAWHIAQICDIDNPERIVFHEITEDAIREAMEHPRTIDNDLRKAQEARRVLDRLVGYDLSGLIWKKIRYGLSAGRVQSPALRILMEREREIRAFTPEDYWVVTADVANKADEEFEATCTETPATEEEATRIVRVGEGGAWRVRSVAETETKRAPRAPFITSTLQQAASSRLSMAPSRTMRVAQQLYEAGHITYMRTDSTALAASAQKEIAALVKKSYGEAYARARTYKTTSKSAQEAHEAIRPTRAGKETAGGTEEQKKLYKLIRERAIASQMADAKILKTKITALVEPQTGEQEIPDFAVTGSRVLFDGWLAADPRSRGDDVEVPKVDEGEALTLKAISSERKQTEPPKRYTEAGLIKELEKRGIGRPSTYATIMKTLADRGYVEKEGRSLIPTDTGEVVSTFLENNFARYISDSFTAEMENELDEIAEGKRGYTETLSQFYEPFHNEVKAKKDIPKLTTLGEAPAQFTCPECGASMVIKLGRGGRFLSCSRYPECEGALTIEGKAIEAPKEIGENCPECETGKLIEREGKYGTFIGCSNYPKCKYVKNNGANDEKNKTDVACPECGKGVLMARRGRYGEFYSCSNYPDCKFALKAKPTGENCPECGSLMMEGTKTIPERCSNKECVMHNPQKLKETKK